MIPPLPEEDKGVSQPVLLLVQLDNIHYSLGGCLVVLGLGDGSSTDDVVPGLELRIGQLVGEASCREGNVSGTFSFVGIHSPRQMAIPASTPLHWYWCITRPATNLIYFKFNFLHDFFVHFLRPYRARRLQAACGCWAQRNG